MSLDIKTDDDGDWIITNGRLQMTSGLPQLNQRIKNRVLLYRGEWFMDRTAGVDYRRSVLTKPFRPALANAAFAAEIIKASGQGTQIVGASLSPDAQTRVLTAEYTIISPEGAIADSFEVNAT